MSTYSMNSHMNFRLSIQDKKMIEMAAKLKGLKPNTYARQKLLESAEKDISETNQLNPLVLNSKDWEQFMKIMDAPVTINKNLKKAILHFNKTYEM